MIKTELFLGGHPFHTVGATCEAYTDSVVPLVVNTLLEEIKSQMNESVKEKYNENS